MFQRKKRMTFETLAQEWLALRRSEVKPATLANYRTLIKTHLIPAFGSRPVSKLTEAEVRTYLVCLSDTGLSASTRRSVQLTLHMVLSYGVRQGLMKPIDFPPMPTIRRPAADTLTDEDFFQLENNLMAHLDATALGILICMYTGLRIGEICALRWSEIDLSAGTVTVSRTLQRVADPSGTHILIDTPKSFHSIRTVPIPRQLLPLLTVRACPPGAYLLTGTQDFMEPRRLQRNFKCILRRAGLRPVKFHTLRHTFATRCASLTDPKTLSCLLGHSNVSTTMALYVHPSAEQMRRCVDGLSTQSRISA